MIFLKTSQKSTAIQHWQLQQGFPSEGRLRRRDGGGATEEARRRRRDGGGATEEARRRRRDGGGATEEARRRRRDGGGATEEARRRRRDGGGATEEARRRRRDGGGATEEARRRRRDGGGATEEARRRRRDGGGATEEGKHQPITKDNYCHQPVPQYRTASPFTALHLLIVNFQRKFFPSGFLKYDSIPDFLYTAVFLPAQLKHSWGALVYSTELN